MGERLKLKKNNKPINNTETDVEEQEHIWVIVVFWVQALEGFNEYFSKTINKSHERKVQ